MRRKALLIGAPGNNLPGVEVDVKNLSDFLTSAAGGFWYQSEIDVLWDPSRLEVDWKLELLKSADYSFVFFAGHGRHSVERNQTQLQLRPNVHIEVSSLIRAGASKQSVIIDACRVLYQEVAMESATVAVNKAVRNFSESNSRQIFDNHLAGCYPGVMELYSCDLAETAGENGTDGGYYTSSLVRAGKEWASGANRGQVMSLKVAHDAASNRVNRLSSDKQHPSASYPRTQVHFPFSIS